MVKYASHVGKMVPTQTWISPFEVVRMEREVDKMKIALKISSAQTDK